MNGLGCVGRVEIGKLNSVWDYMGGEKMGGERRGTLDKEPMYCIHEGCDLFGLGCQMTKVPRYIRRFGQGGTAVE